MEGGVEDRDHRHPGQGRLGGADAGEVGGVVQGGEVAHLLDALDDVVVDEGGGVVLLAAVDDAVADGLDFLDVLDDPVLLVYQSVKDELHADLVVGDVLFKDVLGVADLVGEARLVQTDALHQALGENLLGGHVEELVLDGRGTAVDDED